MKIKGIDVSYAQGTILWPVVKSTDVNFAMIRLGRRGTDGGLKQDTHLEANLAGALEAGIDVGGYFYSNAKTVDQSREEAEFTLNILNKYPKAFTYPIAFDIEDPSQQNLSNASLTKMSDGYLSMIEEEGYLPSLYSMAWWFRQKMDMDLLNKYEIWVAQWPYTLTDSSVSTYTGKHEMWQYSNVGRVNGIGVNVDLNYCYVDYPTLVRTKGYNGFAGEEEAVTPPVNSGEPTPAPDEDKCCVCGCCYTDPDEEEDSTPIVVGNKVRVRNGSNSYTGQNLFSYVYETIYDVLEVNGDRVVIGLGNIITAAMRAQDLYKVV